MPPTIQLVRHAQGVHNITTANHAIPDPVLTDLGHEQCRKLRDKFPFHADVGLVVSSPLRRTLYTALYSFEPVFKRRDGVRVRLIAQPDIQETSDAACDTGSDVRLLRGEFGGDDSPVDLSFLYEGWNDKQGRYAPKNNEIKHRARAARQWLMARPEKMIVVVTHGGFLHYFTEDWEDSSQYEGTSWANAEYRTYEFVDADHDHKDDLEGFEADGGNATLVETAESRSRRGKTTPAPSRDNQKELYKLGIKAWDNKGLALSTAERQRGKEQEGPKDDGKGA